MDPATFIAVNRSATAEEEGVGPGRVRPMQTRNRPLVAATLDPRTIDYINEYASAHGGLPFSRAVEGIIKEHAAAAGAAHPAAAGDEGGADDGDDARR